MILKSHKGLGIDTNINTQKIYPTSRLVSSLMNMPVQPNKAIVDAMRSHICRVFIRRRAENRESYEIMDPTDVGIDKNSLY